MMKKILGSAFLFFASFGMILGSYGGSVYAINEDADRNTGFIFGEDRPPTLGEATSQQNSFRQITVTIVNFILFFLGLLTTAMIIYGGFLYITSGGDDGGTEKAKKILMYSAIGIIVILISFALVNTLLKAGDRGQSGDDDEIGFTGQTGGSS